jgi:flagellar hook-basal body complex protein FliE
MANALDQVQQSQNTASTAEAQAAAGQGSVTNAMIDATQASLDTQVTVALLDKGVAAFTDIMNMTF